MKRKTREEELIDVVTKRLRYLEGRMLSPPEALDDAEYKALQAEAIKLREVLKRL